MTASNLSKQWQQQTCLLTGATGGIGQAIAHALANKGVSLILQGRDENRLQTLVQSLPGVHQILIGDLTDSQSRQDILQKVLRSNELTMLINNAGISHFSSFENASEKTISQIINTNLSAPIALTHALLPLLKQAPNAHIINIGSTFGSIGFAGQTIYCASKFGLLGFTEALYRELADTRINVCYFAPRATKTAINSPQAVTMNQRLGNAMDSPEKVVKALIKQLETGKVRKFVGFPERLFVTINGAFPNIVDKALLKKLPVIKHFVNQKQEEELL